MRNWTCVLLVLMLTGCAHSDPWSRQDTVLQSVVTATLIVDAIQTSEIQYHDNLEEGGWIASQALGRQPSTSDTWMYFGTVALSHYLISRALPQKWRPFWQGGMIAIETKTIFTNCSLGVGRVCEEN